MKFLHIFRIRILIQITFGMIMYPNDILMLAKFSTDISSSPGNIGQKLLRMGFPMLNPICNSGSDPEEMTTIFGVMVKYDTVHIPTKFQNNRLRINEYMNFLNFAPC